MKLVFRVGFNDVKGKGPDENEEKVEKESDGERGKGFQSLQADGPCAVDRADDKPVDGMRTRDGQFLPFCLFDFLTF